MPYLLRKRVRQSFVFKGRRDVHGLPASVFKTLERRYGRKLLSQPLQHAVVLKREGKGLFRIVGAFAYVQDIFSLFKQQTAFAAGISAVVVRRKCLVRYGYLYGADFVRLKQRRLFKPAQNPCGLSERSTGLGRIALHGCFSGVSACVPHRYRKLGRAVFTPCVRWRYVEFCIGETESERERHILRRKRQIVPVSDVNVLGVYVSLRVSEVVFCGNGVI